MPGPGRTAQFPCDGRRLYHDLLRNRIHLALGRSEYQAGASRFQLCAIGFQRTRIAGQVLVCAELQRVDEDAGHDVGRLRTRQFHQMQMAGMQVAHGGHECDGILPAKPLAQGCDGVDDFHQKLCSAAGNSPLLTAAT